MSSEEEGIDNAEGPSPPDSPGKSKDSALLKPKPQPKVIRVLTVLAYILSVSMAAILLSIYYIFMWKGEPHLGARKSAPNVNGTIAYRLAEPLKFQSLVPERGFNDNQPATASTYSDENVTELVGVEDERALVAVKTKLTMSMKINNGVNSTEAQWIKIIPSASDAGLVDTSVKLAGEEAKDRLYEPKHKKKLVRVLTVIAYVFFVSLAAIMLSLYYVFLWNGDKIASRYVHPPEQQIKCDNIVAAMQQQITDDDFFSSLTSTTEESTTWSDYDLNSDQDPDFARTSTFIQKLMGGDPYSEND